MGYAQAFSFEPRRVSRYPCLACGGMSRGQACKPLHSAHTMDEISKSGTLGPRGSPVQAFPPAHTDWSDMADVCVPVQLATTTKVYQQLHGFIKKYRLSAKNADILFYVSTRSPFGKP
jgi:hypothetical protein